MEYSMEYEQLAAFDFVAIMHLLASYIVGMYCSNKDTVYQILKKFLTFATSHLQVSKRVVSYETTSRLRCETVCIRNVLTVAIIRCKIHFFSWFTQITKIFSQHKISRFGIYK